VGYTSAAEKVGNVPSTPVLPLLMVDIRDVSLSFFSIRCLGVGLGNCIHPCFYLHKRLGCCPRLEVTMSTVKTSSVAGLLLVTCALVACSSRPSDGEARKIVEGSWGSMSSVGGKMTDFRKKNGELMEINGQKVYQYEFLAAAELPAGTAWQQDFMGGYKFVKYDPASQRGSMTPLPKGTTAVRSGVITFRQTDNGWVSAYPGKPDDATNSYCTDLKPDACYEKLGLK
jgi:hypothetical protein